MQKRERDLHSTWYDDKYTDAQSRARFNDYYYPRIKIQNFLLLFLFLTSWLCKCLKFARPYTGKQFSLFFFFFIVKFLNLFLSIKWSFYFQKFRLSLFLQPTGMHADEFSWNCARALARSRKKNRNSNIFFASRCSDEKKLRIDLAKGSRAKTFTISAKIKKPDEKLKPRGKKKIKNKKIVRPKIRGFGFGSVVLFR